MDHTGDESARTAAKSGMQRSDGDRVGRIARALGAEPGHSTAVISEIRLAAANLLILLPDPDQRAIVEQDLQTVEDWIDLWLKQPSKAIRTDVPSVQHVLELARDLVVEPKADTSD